MADDLDVVVEPVGRRGRRVAPLVVGVVAMIAAALIWILAGAQPRHGNSDDGNSPLIGRVAPPVTGQLADGTPFQLSRRKGSWVVLNFFTHNCVPCIREHPELIAFVDQQRSLGPQGAEFYTVVRDSTEEQVDAFFAERGGDWPIVYDPTFDFANQFGVALVPETWIIDDAGVVRARLISEVTAAGLGSLIQQMRGTG